MTTLNLGVVVIPYVAQFSPSEIRSMRWRHNKKPWQSLAATVTTGDVAQWLENRYQLMNHFYDMHQRDIARILEDRVQGALENVLLGKAPGGDIFGDLSPIENLFRKAIDNREFDGRIPGVPTKASLRGQSLRRKRPNAKSNPARASFFRSGLFYQSFKAWIDNGP